MVVGNNTGATLMAIAKGFIAPFMLLVVLTACELERRANVEYTNTGQELGARGFREITAYDSKISFTGEDPVKRRESEVLKDRYVERITFKNNSILRYSRV